MVAAYSPLVRAQRFDQPLIVELSKKYGCLEAQLFVRWAVQKGFVVAPKSVQSSRIRSNVDVGWFVIDEEDMKRLDGLDEGLKTATNVED